MKSFTRLLFALLGPFLIVVLVGVLWAVGSCASAAKIALRLQSDLMEHGLRPATLDSIAPLFNRANPSFKASIKVLELSELLEQGQNEEFAKRLASRRVVPQLQLSKEDLAEIQELSVLPISEENKKALQSKFMLLVLSRLTPNPGRTERNIYSFLREVAGFTSLPALPPAPTELTPTPESES